MSRVYEVYTKLMSNIFIIDRFHDIGNYIIHKLITSVTTSELSELIYWVSKLPNSSDYENQRTESSSSINEFTTFYNQNFTVPLY